jgi:hypothetical protein
MLGNGGIAPQMLGSLDLDAGLKNTALRIKA